MRGNIEQKAARPGKPGNNLPKEMVFRFLPNGQVVWYDSSDQGTILQKGYLGNHVVFSIADWIAKKVATVPPILYQVKDEKAHKRYKSLLKDPTPESLMRALDLRGKALEEVEDAPMMELFNRPNEIMSWSELAYGWYVYKAIVGSAYIGGVRSGLDASTGKIQEMWLYPAHLIQIHSEGIYRPISGYSLQSSPDKIIDAANVLQIRNFSPRYENETQWLYGLSLIHI